MDDELEISDEVEDEDVMVGEAGTEVDELESTELLELGTELDDEDEDELETIELETTELELEAELDEEDEVTLDELEAVILTDDDVEDAMDDVELAIEELLEDEGQTSEKVPPIAKQASSAFRTHHA